MDGINLTPLFLNSDAIRDVMLKGVKAKRVVVNVVGDRLVFSLASTATARQIETSLTAEEMQAYFDAHPIAR